MWRMMNLVGRPDTQLYEIAGHGHGAMGNPAYHILIQSINKILGKKYEFQLDFKNLKTQELRQWYEFHHLCLIWQQVVAKLGEEDGQQLVAQLQEGSLEFMHSHTLLQVNHLSSDAICYFETL